MVYEGRKMYNIFQITLSKLGKEKNKRLSGWETDSWTLGNHQPLAGLKEGDIGIPELPSSHRYTGCAAMHRTISSERNSETSWLLHTEQMSKYPHWNGYERLKTHLCHISKPWHRAIQEGTSTFQLLLEEWKVWTAHIVLQLLSSHPRYRSPKHLFLKDNGASSTRSIENKEAVLNGYSSIPHDYPPRC